MLLWWVGEDCQALKTAAAQACLLCLGEGMRWTELCRTSYHKS